MRQELGQVPLCTWLLFLSILQLRLFTFFTAASNPTFKIAHWLMIFSTSNHFVAERLSSSWNDSFCVIIIVQQSKVMHNVNVWILQFKFKGQWQCPSPLPVKALVMLPYMYGIYQYSTTVIGHIHEISYHMHAGIRAHAP